MSIARKFGKISIPSKHPEFLELCEKTVRAAIPEKRNHVCLTFWSGGNEWFDADCPSRKRDVYILDIVANSRIKKMTVRRIQNEAYHAGPYGFCGNEDVGQMSGFSSRVTFPVNTAYHNPRRIYICVFVN